MKVALIGMGSVGKGVAGVSARKDLGLTITGIADSTSGCVDPDGLDIANLLLNKSKNGCCGDRQISAIDVIKKADYDALIEVTPTNALTGEPAIGYIKTALLRKKQVVTPNKERIPPPYKNTRALASK